MKKIFLAFFLFLFASVAAFAQVAEPVKWEKAITELSKGEYLIELSATIDAPWHIYDIKPNSTITPTSFKFTFEGAEGELLGEVSASTEALTHEDPNLGTYGYWENAVKFSQKIKVPTDKKITVKVLAEWMACDDKNCTPPTDEEFIFELNTDAPAVATATATASDAVLTAGEGEKGESKSLWGVILEAIAWGFAALLTPCVFPMVPMTVSFFMKGSGSKAKGRMMAIIFGISIIVLYTLPIAVMIAMTYFIGGDAVTADVFNWLSTHWIPNILFFAIFMIFAASFFGAFEIVIPSWLVNKSDEKSDKGGLIGVFFMALTLVLVSFSCTGPIVGSVLVKSTQGDVWEPIITMFAFSTAFAIPFTMFAFFPSMLKNLPKSGGWLNTVKVVLGFIEVALGFKFLSVADQVYGWNLLDREVYLAIWIVTFFLLGLYLLGKIKFAHDSDEPYLKVKKLFMSIGVFAFVVYMIPGMWGAPLKALSGYLPPMSSIDFNLSKGFGGGAPGHDNGGSVVGDVDYVDYSKVKYADILNHPVGLHGFFDLNEATEYAKKVNKPLFLDFTGAACTNCREMEANVLSDPAVKKIINDHYVFVSIFVDSKIPLPESEWVMGSKGKVLKHVGKINADYQISKYHANAQPYYVTTDHDANMLSGPAEYNKDVQVFIEFLNKGVEAFKKK